MLKIKRPDKLLRMTLFPTRHREETKGLYVRYTYHPPDPRIDAVIIDHEHARTGRLGIGWNYLVLLDGTVEVARHPRSMGAMGREMQRLFFLQIGVVGGKDKETGKWTETLTPAQRETLDALYQQLADILGIPLEIDESLTKYAFEQHEQAEASEAEVEARLTRDEALTGLNGI